MSKGRMNDEMLISAVLKRTAEDVPRRRDLPDPHYLWLTSQLMPNVAAQERALKPMGLLQIGAHTIVALCWAGVITWKWNAIRSWFDAPDAAARLLDAVFGAGSLPLSLIVLVGGLLCITTVVILHGVLAEE